MTVGKRLRSDAFMVVLVGWIRSTYVITGVLMIVVMGRRAYPDVAGQWLLLASATAWTAVLFRSARRAGQFSRSMAWADTAIAVLLLVLVTRGCVPGERLTWGNWAFTFGLSTALIAGVACTAVECAVATTVLIGVFVGALWPTITAHELQATNLIGNPMEFAWFACMAVLGSRYLRRVDTRLDAAVAAQVSAESRRAALEARVTHYRMLHDTVLSTLTAIARGGLDYRADSVRARCARETDYLRRLIHADIGSGHAGIPSLDDALCEAAREAEELGLRVHCRTGELPDLPAPVVTAFGDAVREALNNVRVHSGASEAWVTGVGDEARVTVTVVDRGRGFDSCQLPATFGIQRSIIGRMADVGGAAEVISARDEDTSVELRWPS
jgi:signal transduction histidine kinase